MATCVTCGRAFEPCQKTQKYCGEKCRNRGKTRGKSRPVLVKCERCGKEFTTRNRGGAVPGVRGGTARFCSKSCARSLTLEAVALRAAKRAAAQLLKSVVCRVEAAQFELSFQRDCIVCGKRFLPARTLGCRAYCCSDECRELQLGKRKRRAGRIAKSRRRARIRNVKHESIDPLDVFARDHWTCQICGDKTPRRLRGTYDDKAPELDHIISLAAGGTHTWNNVQCACRACNGTKGAGAAVDQLRLELTA